MKIFALILFLLTYAGMIALPKYRPYIALGSAAVFVIAGVMPLGELPGAVDWNVLMMLAGTMGTVGLFIESRMPNRMAEVLLENICRAVPALEPQDFECLNMLSCAISFIPRKTIFRINLVIRNHHSIPCNFSNN